MRFFDFCWLCWRWASVCGAPRRPCFAFFSNQSFKHAHWGYRSSEDLKTIQKTCYFSSGNMSCMAPQIYNQFFVVHSSMVSFDLTRYFFVRLIFLFAMHQRLRLQWVLSHQEVWSLHIWGILSIAFHLRLSQFDFLCYQSVFYIQTSFFLNAPPPDLAQEKFAGFW